MFICVVMKNNGEYDCILNNTLYKTKDEVETAVKQAIREDKISNWKYRYEVVNLENTQTFNVMF